MQVWGVKCKMRPMSSPIFHSTHKDADAAATAASVLRQSGIFAGRPDDVWTAVFEEVDDLADRNPPSNREYGPLEQEQTPMDEYRCAVPFCRRPGVMLYDSRLWCVKCNGTRPAKRISGVFKVLPLEE